MRSRETGEQTTEEVNRPKNTERVFPNYHSKMKTKNDNDLRRSIISLRSCIKGPSTRETQQKRITDLLNL